MSRIFVHGLGAVSPAGWGLQPLRQAISQAAPLPSKPLSRPGQIEPWQVRQVPPPAKRPDFLGHSRLRRTSPITHHVVASSLEAIGADAALVTNGKLRLGVVLCVMSGCVSYSRRFYDEALRDPATASPLVFPETVFNAPASHIAALLGTPAMNYTIVGDPATFLQGVAVAAQWLVENQVDAALVIGAEEADWLTSSAYRLFSHEIILSDGAGALYLKKDSANALAELRCITDPHLFLQNQNRSEAASRARSQLPASRQNHLLADGLLNLPKLDAAEAAAWHDWAGSRISPKAILGEGLMAAAAWQCVIGVDAIHQKKCAAVNVSTVGCNEQAIAAQFVGTEN